MRKMKPNKQAYNKQDGDLRMGVVDFLQSKERKHGCTYFSCDYPTEVGKYEQENG